ncbi:MAG: ABC transporter permease subunit, partial [Pseudomonadota bacterium]
MVMQPEAPRSKSQNDFPYWLVALVIIALAIAGVIAANDLYAQVFGVVSKGVQITIFVTLVGFALATGLGLLLALMALSNSIVLRQVARFYVEVVRGIPMLVLLFYIAFVGAPALAWLINAITVPFQESG